MSSLAKAVAMLLVSISVSALSLGLYDRFVRQPRTPRIAVVDIAKLFTAVEQRAKAGVLSGQQRAAGGLFAVAPAASSAQAAEMAGLQAAESFGPAVEKVLGELSGECRCVIVAMAAVIGGAEAVPDFTPEAARRLGVQLRAGYSP